MKKKFSLILVVCLLLSLATGCTKKPFGMPIEDLRAEINTNLQSLSCDMEFPEFESEYGQESVNGGEAKENGDLISYVSYINDYCGLTIAQPRGASGSSLRINLHSPTEDEFIELLPDGIAIVSAVIMTVDPEANVQEVLDALNFTSPETSEEITYQTNNFTYKSATQFPYITLRIEQFPSERQSE